MRNLSEYISLINDTCEEFSGTVFFPKLFHDALFYTLLNGGKRLRGLLFLSTVDMFYYDIDKVKDIACALEMIHAYSLIHDDLPAMDNDDVRRGKPSNHKIFGEGMAMLAGDGLNSLAYEIILSNSNISDSSKVEILRLLSSYTGIHGMVVGQACDVLVSNSKLNDNLRFLVNFIHKHKTAKFIQASVLCGGIIGSADKEEMNKLYKYALYIGIAFQIVDDCLDVVGDENKMGKKKVDIINNALTYPKVYGLKRSYEMVKLLYDSALKQLQYFKNSDNLIKIAKIIIERDR